MSLRLRRGPGGHAASRAPVAQRTEQLPSKQEVVGSNPARGASQESQLESTVDGTCIGSREPQARGNGKTTPCSISTSDSCSFERT